MSNHPNSSGGAVATANMPVELQSLLGRAPLLRTESSQAYDALTAQCAAALDPQDMIEWLMIRDYVDLTWEILRLRRMKQHLLKLGAPDAIFRIAEELRDGRQRGEAGGPAVQAWIKGGAARQALYREFARHDVDEETIAAEAFLHRFGSIEKFEDVLKEKEALRRGVLRDLEAYRDSSLWARRRIAAQEIEALADRAVLAPPSGRRGASGAPSEE